MSRHLTVALSVLALAASGILALGLLFQGNDGAPGTGTAQAVQLCVEAARGDPNGRVTPPLPQEGAEWFRLPKSFHDWDSGNSLFAWFEDDPSIIFQTNLRQTVVIPSPAISNELDGRKSVHFAGKAFVADDRDFDLPQFLFTGLLEEMSTLREVDADFSASLSADGSVGRASLSLDGKVFHLDARNAPHDAESAACDALQHALTGNWRGFLETFDNPGLELTGDEIEEAVLQIQAAVDGQILSAGLNGPLSYVDQGETGYPVAYGRVRMTIRRGKLTTVEGSNIALVYRGSWKLMHLGQPDEFEDSGQGAAVVIAPDEDGLFWYHDEWRASLLVQLDPGDPAAGRFLYSAPLDGIFWAKTPGTLSTGPDGLTRLIFDGEGMHRANRHRPSEGGTMFEPPDDEPSDDPDDKSQPGRFKLEVTFRDGGKSVSGSITNEHGTKRFSILQRRHSPMRQLERAFGLLRAGDFAGLEQLRRGPGKTGSVATRLPSALDLASAELSPSLRWHAADVAHVRVLVRTGSGYQFVSLQAAWSQADNDWSISVRQDFETITPTVCIEREGDGSQTAHFGYKNPWDRALIIPSNTAANQIVNGLFPLPETFEPGTHHRVFSVALTGSPITWQLNGKSAVARTQPSAGTRQSTVEPPCR